jgi:hypothetical protein
MSMFVSDPPFMQGRAIVRNGLYLPRLLPPLSHLWSRDQINHHSRNFQPLQRSPHPDGSDSDNFTYEVDWDAHLAYDMFFFMFTSS